MRRVVSVAIVVLVAVFGIALTPATASAAASCTGSSYFLNDVNAIVTVPTIGDSTHRTNCELGFGNTGWGVYALQETLNYCYGRRLALDGIFGPRTQAALIYAQGVEHIWVDGIYGPQSRDHLKWSAWGQGCARL